MTTDPLWINADGGAPEYAADELRRNMSGLMLGGWSNPTGARAGVRPGHVPLVLFGSTVVVAPVPVVLYPAHSATDGPYLGHLPQAEHALAPAASSPRRDIIVARVYDDDHDESGRRELVTEYITGAPASNPSLPGMPAGAMRLGHVYVPASGGGAPSLTVDVSYTVANGGILPVRESWDRPSDGRYEGMTVFRQDTGGLEVWNGTAWALLASAAQPVAAWNTTTYSGMTNTAYAATSTPVGFSFVAPASGKGMLVCSARINLEVTGTVSRIALGTPWLGTGGTVNGGSAVAIEGTSPPHDTLAFGNPRAHNRVPVSEVDRINSDTYLIEGLTPGSTYNASQRYRMTAATQASYLVERQRIRWIPL